MTHALLGTSARKSYIKRGAAPLGMPTSTGNFPGTETDLGTSAGKLYIKSEEAPPDMPALTEDSSDVKIDTIIQIIRLLYTHSPTAMRNVVDM